MNKPQGIIWVPVLIIILAVTAFATTAIVVYQANLSEPTATTPTQTNTQVCTDDTEPCSDGSYVSRTGPNCAFAACPTVPNENWKTYSNGSLGFSIRYPELWGITEANTKDAVYVFPIELGGVTIGVNVQVQDEDLDAYLDTLRAGEFVTDVSVTGSFVVGADTGTEITVVSNPVGGSRTHRFIRHNNRSYIISFVADEAEDIDVVIASTFAFTQAATQTYENTKLGYTFAFPAGWNLQDCGSMTYVGVNPPGTPAIVCESEGWSAIQINVSERAVDTVDVTIANAKSGLLSSQESTITLDGQTATKLVGTSKGCQGPCPNEGTAQQMVVFLRGGDLYIIRYYGDQGDYVAEFDAFLSSLKFSDSTADWQTYRDEKYGFTLKYPKDWRQTLYTTGYNEEGEYVLVFTPPDPSGPLPFLAVKANWSVDKEVTAIQDRDPEFTRILSRESATIGVYSYPAIKITYSTAIGATPTRVMIDDNGTVYSFDAYPDMTEWDALMDTFRFPDLL